MATSFFDFIKKLFFITDSDEGKIELLDHKQVAKRLKIKKQAKIMGLKNLPAPEENHASYLEKSIKSFYEQQLIKHQDNLANKVNNYRDTLIKEYDLQDTIAAISALPSQYLEKLEQQRSSDRENIERLTAELKWAECELETFKSKNGIPKEAVPEEKKKLPIVFIILPVAADLLLNLLLFYQSIAGLVGVGLCIFIALTNSVLSYQFGQILNHLNMKSVSAKTKGYFSSFALILIVPLNLLFAHLREASHTIIYTSTTASFDELLKMQADLLKIASFSMINHPIRNIYNLNSMFLFILGLSIAIFSAVSGWKSSEKYPDFIATFNRVAQLRSLLNKAKDKMRHTATYLKDEFIKKLEILDKDAQNMMTEASERLNSFLTLSSNAIKKYTLLEKDCINGYEFCIHLARHENLMHRSDNAKPIIFTFDPEPLSIPDIGIGIENERNMLSSIEKHRGIITQKRDEIRNKLIYLYNMEKRKQNFINLNRQAYRYKDDYGQYIAYGSRYMNRQVSNQTNT